ARKALRGAARSWRTLCGPPFGLPEALQMKTLARFIVMIGAAALFAGCVGSQPPIGASGAMAHTSTTSSSYNVIFRFGSAPRSRSRGRRPGGLINVAGTFYGTTRAGGGSNDGTFYSLSTAGKDKILYRFHDGSDAEAPQAALLDVSGTL